MHCQKCQAAEAMVHITEKWPEVPLLNLPESRWTLHLCESCDQALRADEEQYRQQEQSPFRPGMSALEKAEALQMSREQRKQHIQEWIREGLK
jgi:protein-arginine kinase activator protein McsA